MNQIDTINIMLSNLNTIIMEKHNFISAEDAKSFYSAAYGICADLWTQKATLELEQQSSQVN